MGEISPLQSLIILNILKLHKEELIKNAAPLLNLMQPKKLVFDGSAPDLSSTYKKVIGHDSDASGSNDFSSKEDLEFITPSSSSSMNVS